VFGVRQSRTFELIRLFSYENDLHSRVKLGINKSKDSFTGVHSIIVQFSKVIVSPQRRLVYSIKLRSACQAFL
ncbi:MAG: hypothetical protein KH448_09730, partial [Megasphaera sp.]|nr:hypothetical protein [Megasphaera sp.]